MYLTAYYYLNYKAGDENIILDSTILNNESGAIPIDSSSAVFPNPSSGNFTAKFISYESGNARVSIYSIEGKKMMVLKENLFIEKGENHLEVNTELANGVYFFVVMGEKVNLVQKIIIIN